MNISADNLKNKNMSKRKLFAPLMGAVVLGLSAYAGYRTYNAYNGVSESDLLLANAEALANGEYETYTTWSCDASSLTPCHFKCDACKTEVSGTGKGSGTHTCRPK